jgi:hypothetical protein
LTTVELIVINKIILLRIAYDEVHLGRIVKGAGGKWYREKQAWELPCGQVRSLVLENRIILEND